MPTASNPWKNGSASLSKPIIEAPIAADLLFTLCSTVSLFQSLLPILGHLLTFQIVQRTTLLNSTFWKAVTRLSIMEQLVASYSTPSGDSTPSIPKIDRIVCLGLGSMESSAIGANRARAQFAFLLLLLDHFKAASGSQTPIVVSICEPMFSRQDAALARHFGIELLENRCGRYSQAETLPLASSKAHSSSDLASTSQASSTGTLYWMPHCPKELYAALLQANWTPSLIAKTVIIGNSFQDIVDAPFSSADQPRLGRIFAAVDICSAARIPEYSDDPFIFSHSSIHMFSSEKHHSSNDPFWTIPEAENVALEACLKNPDMSFKGSSSSNR